MNEYICTTDEMTGDLLKQATRRAGRKHTPDEYYWIVTILEDTQYLSSNHKTREAAEKRLADNIKSVDRENRRDIEYRRLKDKLQFSVMFRREISVVSRRQTLKNVRNKVAKWLNEYDDYASIRHGDCTQEMVEERKAAYIENNTDEKLRAGYEEHIDWLDRHDRERCKQFNTPLPTETARDRLSYEDFCEIERTRKAEAIYWYESILRRRADHEQLIKDLEADVADELTR